MKKKSSKKVSKKATRKRTSKKDREIKENLKEAMEDSVVILGSTKNIEKELDDFTQKILDRAIELRNNPIPKEKIEEEKKIQIKEVLDSIKNKS